MGERTLASKAAMEFVGTAMLLMVAGTGAPAGAVCGVLVGIIYMGFELSGAHYNPAVTLTFLLRGEVGVADVLLYVPAQVMGGLFGAYVGQFMTISIVSKPSALAVTPFMYAHDSYTLSQALCCEVAFTFALCFSVLTIALRQGSVLNPVFGVAITGIIYAGISCTAAISGAAFNPAVAISLAVINGGNLFYAACVCVANFAGALLATAVFYIVAPEQLKALPWGWARYASAKLRVGEDSPLLS